MKTRSIIVIASQLCAALALAFTLNVIAPSQANALAIIAGSELSEADEFSRNEFEQLALAPYFGIGGSAGMVVNLFFKPFQGVGLAITLICLDADGALNTSALENSLTKQYPFLDNPNTISNIAQNIKSKVPSNLKLAKGQRYGVALTEEETKLALIESDLTQEQFNQIVSDLK